MGILDGKVALITGAGGGLGRAYAHLFASEGAKVVVNDLGVDRHGGDGETKMAEKVVAEITEAGGTAVANFGSVCDPDDAQAMVDQAVDTYGQIDIVVNNAGILRDKTLVKLTKDMWDIVIDVHLTGTYLVTRAAVLAMKGDGGRIINTSSLAGLKGNFGQTNYGAAKAGIAGLTRVVAMETRKAGITVNAIAPVAKTRMTDDLDMVPDDFEPEDIAPLICWLASDASADVTGRVFGAHGSHYFEWLVEQTPGVDLGNDRWTPAMVGERFGEVTKKKAVAKSGGGSGGDKVRALFEALPATFLAEKAAGWTANLVFEIGGDATYSLVIADGAATFQEGAASPSKAKVQFDSAETILEMASGKLAPEQAFMAGKIKTDNMGALMKFGQYFDLAKAGSSGGASGAAAIFEALPSTFKKEKAGDWSTKLLFDVGGDLYGLEVEAGEARYVEGGVDSPKAKVTFDSEETIMAMAAGKLAPEQAFMQGKISTDNMGALMKFGQYFDLAKAVPSGDGGGHSGPKEVNEGALGKKYRGAAVFVEPAQIDAYAKATDDDNDAYEDGKMAPPIFPVKPLFGVMTEAVADPELNADLLRLVHGEQDMYFHRPLKSWDLVAPRAEIQNIEKKSSGTLIDIHQRLMVDGQPVTEVISGIFVRGESKGGEKKEKPPYESPAKEIIYEESQTVADDQPLRYADASDDHNPIHVDESVAQSAGHPSVILHGLCTMAFAGRAVVNGVCDGNPAGLKRLKVRFSKPVLPGQTLTTRIWKESESNGVITLGLDVVTEDDQPVITHGLAEVAL